MIPLHVVKNKKDYFPVIRVYDPFLFFICFSSLLFSSDSLNLGLIWKVLDSRIQVQAFVDSCPFPSSSNISFKQSLRLTSKPVRHIIVIMRLALLVCFSSSNFPCRTVSPVNLDIVVKGFMRTGRNSY